MALDFVAGCVGGCVGVLVGHPFDTVKVRLQTQDAKKPVYRGTYHCLSLIVKKESAIGLFRGMSSPMAGLGFINAIVFGVYGTIQRHLSEPNSIRGHFLSGCTAGLVQSLVTSPMEMTKIRIQLQGQLDSAAMSKSIPKGALYKNPFDCLAKVHRADGIRGLYKGFSVTVLRDAPGFGVYFACNEFFTRKIFADEEGNLSTPCLMVAGGMAGVTSWMACYPTDVIKSRLQADGASGTKAYASIWDCVVKSYRAEGPKVFFRGFNTTIIRAFPVNATTFSVVAWVIKTFGETNPHSAARLLDKEATVPVKVNRGMDNCI